MKRRARGGEEEVEGQGREFFHFSIASVSCVCSDSLLSLFTPQNGRPIRASSAPSVQPLSRSRCLAARLDELRPGDGQLLGVSCDDAGAARRGRRGSPFRRRPCRRVRRCGRLGSADCLPEERSSKRAEETTERAAAARPLVRHRRGFQCRHSNFDLFLFFPFSFRDAPLPLGPHPPPLRRRLLPLLLGNHCSCGLLKGTAKSFLASCE
jgi:hypothetical protein